MGIVIRPGFWEWDYWRYQVDYVANLLVKNTYLNSHGLEYGICLSCRRVGVAKPKVKSPCPSCLNPSLTAKSDLKEHLCH